MRPFPRTQGRAGRYSSGLLAPLLALACGGSSAPKDAGEGAKAKPAEVGAPSGLATAPSLDPSTLPGSIVFLSERDGNLEVYRWRAGAEPERLTNDPRADFVAEVAPDGSGWTRIATEEGAVPEAHREQLSWVPTTGNPVLVGPSGRRARAASWAPDRSFVVFESDAALPAGDELAGPPTESFSDVWRWEPGGTLTRLTQTEHGAFEPAVSPNGRSIAFVSTRDGNPELYLMGSRGEQPRRLTDWRRDDMVPRWSPEGTRLAFLRREQGGERLFVLTIPDEEDEEGEEGEPRRLVATAEGERVKHADHAWSPDGTQLVYTVHRPGQPPHVALTEVASGRTRVVSPEGLHATMPSWSPDGQALVLVGTEGDPEALDLYAVRLADGAWVRLTDAPAPDWQPRWTAL